MENRAKVFEGSTYWQQLAVNMVFELRIHRLLMEDDHFSFRGADGQAHAEANLVHTGNQVLQPMRRPGKTYAVESVL